MNDVRTAVMEALEKLPDSVRSPEQYLDLYRTDKELLAAVESLYLTLLRALEAMLAWMEHKTSVHLVKAIVLQASYEKSTMEKIAAIKPTSDKVSAQIEFCFQSRVKEIWRHTTQLSEQVPSIIKQTEHTEEQLEEILNRLDAATGLKFMLSENKKMAEWRHQDELRREREREEDKKRYIEALQHQQATEQALLFMQQQISRSTTPVNVNVVQYIASPAPTYALAPPPPPVAPVPLITLSQIFTVLRPDLNAHTQDLDEVISHGCRLPPAESRRGTWLMRQPVFQSWFNSNESRIQLVEGQERDRPITSLSYFLAVLEEGLHDDGECAVLSYFCGLHTEADTDYYSNTPAFLMPADGNENESEAGTPISIMTSLLGQLVTKTQISFNTGGVNDMLLSYAAQHDLGALCALFRILITTCAPTTVFILIDSISWLETRGGRLVDDAQGMFAFFRDLVAELTPGSSAPSFYSSASYPQPRRSNVKILLTSARRCIEFQQYFDEDQCFSMPVAPAVSASGGKFVGEQFVAEMDAIRFTE
ncbi:hypothetical protein PVAG01_00198 [Phlyctema vagabunda]|uniref:Uncharacterized protein n=1 Tax=Phlyctema vagabunda TaxID=108571 RepID=A0ABR4PTJ2_9HELO